MLLLRPRPCLCPGLKRYFHSKRGAGLLSSQGLRILDFACDRAMDCPHRPLVSRAVRLSEGGEQEGGGAAQGSAERPSRLLGCVLPAQARLSPGLVPVLPPPSARQDIWSVAEREAVGKYLVK